MLGDTFLTRLSTAFPTFYERVNSEAAAEAERLRGETRGDMEKAILRARFEGATRLWWPYVKGSAPIVGDDADAMEAFTRLILVIDHLVGHHPASMEAARDQVVAVLRNSIDVERLRRLVASDAKDSGAAKAGLVASFAAVMTPLSLAGRAGKLYRFMPPALRLTLAGVVVAALASIPIVAGYSAGRQAERTARGAEVQDALASGRGAITNVTP